MSDWKPAPPDDSPATLRKGVDAVLALIDQHRGIAAQFTAHSTAARADAARLARRGRLLGAVRERDRARRASRTAREHLGLTYAVVEALTDAWDQWPEYAAFDDGKEDV